MGYALVCELVNRGIEVIAFARNKEKMQRLYETKLLVTIVEGDVFDHKQLNEAVSSVDVIFHAINVPYQQWLEKQPLLMNAILEVAKLIGPLSQTSYTEGLKATISYMKK
jgi:putative NADH-flavin reductase